MTKFEEQWPTKDFRETGRLNILRLKDYTGLSDLRESIKLCSKISNYNYPR